MDLKQLRTFLTVAETGSLSRAAERLNIAQPALGRQIRLLEEELSVPLFTRHGRGMMPTPSGELLADRATAILRMVEDTRAAISADANAVKGTVSLGVPPTVGEVIAGHLAERFLTDYPEVTLRIVPAFSGYLLDMIQRGEADLAVMYETGAVQNVRSEPLIEETLYLIGPPGSAPPEPVDFRSLAGRPLILPGPRHGLRKLLEAAAREHDIALRVIVEADALQTLKDLVMRGLGYTVLPLAAVHTQVEAGELSAIDIRAPAVTRKMVLVRSLARPETNAVRIFADTLKAETASMVRHGIWEGQLLF
ncbi:LysR substrate-binding domain-containing protein [Nisaea acidiphila]|uniref:LysR substrate-binding domain-containing protein n=1 Tax=Nisaea acidiphila TaxID=1862145 RepID=A0A9J7AU80_9PROT|nr:LysR substrate-binding domain-containing protein [Nisaea acidiphila]UUX50879.1 LysR substrate-binding domain-containing protein [Nisaea acidiphila]